MELDRFLNLLAATLGAMGSLYVLKGLASLSPDLLARLSGTYYDFNSAQLDALVGQKVDSLIGMILVLLAFSVAAGNIAFMRPGSVAFQAPFPAISLVAAIVIASWGLLLFLGRWLRKRQRLLVGAVMTRRMLHEIFEMGKLAPSYAASVRGYASTLLRMKPEQEESTIHFLERVAERVGLKVPQAFDRTSPPWPEA